MSKSSGHVQVLTANRLGDGAVVFLNFDGDWVANLTGVVSARSPDEARGLEARGQFDAGRNLVVDPYLVDMREIAGALIPLRQRERVRLQGPSILNDVPGYRAPASLAAAAASGPDGDGTESDTRGEPPLPGGRTGPRKEAA
jgi:hypothetical protein